MTVKDHALPDRCIKCNTPAEGFSVVQHVRWHNPRAYLTLLLGLVVYVVVALLISKHATVGIPLCPAHRRLRRNLRLAALASLFGFPALAVALVDVSPAAFDVCLISFVLAPLALLVASNVARVAHIDHQLVRLRAGQPFLDSLTAR